MTGPRPSACRHSNVVILTTSNITERIDVAFVDRADIRQYIGPPSAAAVFKIYLSCLEELMKVPRLPLCLAVGLVDLAPQHSLGQRAPTCSEMFQRGLNCCLGLKVISVASGRLS